MGGRRIVKVEANLPSLPSFSSSPSRHSVVHFLLRLLDDVILLVDIRSPMYFWRNLLWLSSLSCSSLTASILLKRVTRESCNVLACLRATSQPGCFSCWGPNLNCQSRGATTHLCNSSLASWPSAWMSSLVLLGLMALTSSGPICISTGPTASESRGTIMVPLLLRLGSFGRTGFGAWMSKDAPDDESDQSGLGVLLASPIMNYATDAAE